jgi:putative spermidine/putrescine transport system substrate-binding protein
MTRRPARTIPFVAAALLLALAAGCSSSGGGGGSSGGQPQGFKPPNVPMQQSLGAGEGQVNLVAWAGYVENGSTDPKVNWVTPFQQATGCKVNVKVAGTSDEMVQLMRSGQYDGVSASGDATLRLIAAGDVAPVNTNLVPNYKDVFDGLKLKPWNSVNGVAYGIPHGRGANLLMWRTDKVKPAPDSWGVVFDPASPYKGKVTAYDSPIYIADAALYLKATKPDLGISNPYELDDKQFQASVDLLKQQAGLVGEYWSDYTKEIQAFKTGSSVVGTTWQIIANLAQADKAPVQVILPKEGATGWSDTWMISSKAAHPNCMYRWMDHIVSPKVNAQVAEWFGEAPANRLACKETSDPKFCQVFHADDENYFSKVAYWNTPIKDCGDSRGSACVDYSQWTRAWTEIKG